MVTDDGKLLLNRPFRDGENQFFFTDAVPQTVVLDILRDDQRDGEDAMFAGLLLHNFKTEPSCFCCDVRLY